MTALLLGIGTAVPDRAAPQDATLAIARAIAPHADAAADRTITALYRRAGVTARGSVLLDAREPSTAQSFFPSASTPADRGPGTAARLARFALEAPPLAHRAAAAALADAGLRAPDITHLVTASCTGFSAPGVDAALIASLGLRPTVLRTHVGFMGCHGALNALRVAKAFAESGPDARVLVVAVELCSLHFHYAPTPDQTVANALFADGAAAAVISATHSHDPPHPLRLAESGSCLLPDSGDAMTWTIGDHGFEMTLSPRVPDLIARHLAPWLRTWLDSQRLGVADVGSWAIHPGGPRVVSSVLEALDLPPAAGDASRAVLAARGNMSSPTVLFILDHLRRASAPRPTVLLAFGPGLTAEAALLT